ncbi:MAG: PDZ domain-containing protein [Anaerolineae bacterium]|nr:PDZ domain-containing protein [Anaerolineae bacterium]
MNKKLNFIILPSLLATLALPACSGASMLSLESTPLALLKSSQANPIAVSGPASIEAVAAVEGALENIYTTVNPSVVSIQVSQRADSAPLTQMPDFPFRFFFGNPQNPGLPQQQLPQEQFRHGAGSGFVWDKEGHIITNNHVVDGADSIRVTFADGSTAAASVVGADPDSDLAVLKVDMPAERLQPVEVADSSQVKVGQLAVAIGNPFTLENTMTVGIVSAMGRQLPVSSGNEAQNLEPAPTYTIPDIIQTDAPINPGNSGGVLVNDQGQMIGVTAAIESPVRASAGIGFAIPSNIVQKVVPELIKSGQYEHPWLGLSGTSLNPDLAAAMDLKEDQRGALVIDVTPGSPADQAGLQGSDRQVEIEGEALRVGGDVVIAINGEPVHTFDDLVAYLAGSTQIGQSVKLTVLRSGKEETISVTPAPRPTANRQQGGSEKEAGGGVWLGIQGLGVTPALAEKLGLQADQKGVLVEQVEVNSPADEAGLRGSFKPTTINGEAVTVGGDIITAVGGQPVESLADLQNFLQQAAPGQKITLTIMRDGKSLEVSVTLAEQPAGPVS